MAKKTKRAKVSAAPPPRKTPAASAPNSVQVLPPTAQPVGNYAQFTDAGATVQQTQPGMVAADMGDNDSPLATADGTQQFVYTSSAPLIPAGNPNG